MGLILSAIGAVGSTLGDQWKEALRCEDLGNDILMKKVTTKNGVITNKSTIIVGPGQCAIIYDNGRVIDATAEEGIYTFDTSSSPSFFAGQFGPVFKEMWQRFTYKGASAKQQAVFFFNTKEIINNTFGTKTPVLFQDWSHPIPNRMTGKNLPLSLKVKCFGKYTFRLEDPATFMNEIAGMAEEYTKEQLCNQMLAEVLDAFQNIVNGLGTEAKQIPALELPSQTDEIKEMLANSTYDEAIRRRGFKITGFSIEGVSLDEESEKKITEYEHNSNAYMQQGRVLNVMEAAANNANGSANGFMGVGMMNMASGGMGSGVMNDAFAATGNGAGGETPANSGNNGNTEGAKFCTECGAKLTPDAKFCPNCGKKI